jgi:ABC-type cobalamin/Fe3+-siderophores transport system ATPase subunit
VFNNKNVFAAHFWRRAEQIRTSYKGNTQDFERVLLPILFLCIVRRSGDLLQSGKEMLGDVASDAISFLENIFISKTASENYGIEKQWSDICRGIQKEMAPDVTLSECHQNLDREFLIKAFNFIFHALESDDLQQNILVYDRQFTRLACDELKVDWRHAQIVGALANAASPRSWTYSIGEAFCITGDCAVDPLWRRPSRDLRPVRQMGSFGFELALRLALRRQRRLQWNENFQHLAPLVLIDAPVIGTRNLPFRPTYPKIPTLASTSLEMLDALISKNIDFFAIVIVRGADRNGRGARENLRQTLIENRRVNAVIDLPVPGPGASKAKLSAWLLQPLEHSQQKEILFVNARALDHLHRSREPLAAIAFVSQLIASWKGDQTDNYDWVVSGNADTQRLHDVFEREFANGYKDLDGLCRKVSFEEVAKSQWTLSAEQYLTPIRAQTNSWLSGLDGATIESQLHDVTKSGRCFYVIGNNGVGKSILLRELASHLISKGRSCIGIAFNLTDRFDLQSTNKNSGSFIYLGARTSSAGTTSRHWAEELGRRLYAIYQDPARAQIFMRTCELVGINAQFYLTPISKPSNRFEADALVERTLHLVGPNNDKTVESIPQTRIKSGYQPALQRFNSNDSITAFLDLSSGEQQILGLTIKLITEAKKNSVIFIDEPETSLHVSWQRSVPFILRLVAQEFSCDMVIATHSPLLITSANQPTDHCYAAQRQRLISIPINDRRSVETVLFEGFDTYTPNNRQVHEQCANIVALAIERVNADGSADVKLQELRSELFSMAITIRGQNAKIAPPNWESDLRLVDEAMAAIDEIRVWAKKRQGESS